MIRTFHLTAYALLSCFMSVGMVTAAPRLICVEPTYNFGEREEGDFVEHTFAIRNMGDAPAELKKPRPQCGCMTVQIDTTHDDVIAPGAEMTITAKMSLSRQRGQVRNSVLIPPGNGNREPLVLTMEGAVTSTLLVAPEKIVLGQAESGNEIVRTVIVAFTQKEAVKITRCESDARAIQPTLETLREGSLYRATIRVMPRQETSTIQAQVSLHTDSKKHPVVNIPITGTVVGDLVATPNANPSCA